MKYTILCSMVAGACLFLFSGCETPTTSSCATDFDQLSLLSNIGNNIIAPTYQTFATEANDLNAAAIAFSDAPSTSTLSSLKTKFQQTWLTWQSASIFEFGPAHTEELRSYMNNFPVFTTRLEDAVASGSYDLMTETYSFTRGFPALDYLLYGVGADENAVVSKYTTDNNAANRKQFLKDVTALILQKANAVNDAWKATGANYLNTFTTTEGVANGKPLSDLVNQLNANYELIKNDKLGTPIGAKTSYIPLIPQNVEAYYSRKSIELAVAALQASKNVFLGFTNGANNVGLDDYLMAAGTKKGSEDLHTLISNQYDLAISSLTALQPATLHDAITNNTDAVKTAYANAQNQVVYTKTDMPAALCISITYVDQVDDGD